MGALTEGLKAAVKIFDRAVKELNHSRAEHIRSAREVVETLHDLTSGAEALLTAPCSAVGCAGGSTAGEDLEDILVHARALERVLARAGAREDDRTLYDGFREAVSTAAEAVEQAAVVHACTCPIFARVHLARTHGVRAVFVAPGGLGLDEI